jgi:branched-chain amino acid transport system ATP-binding protein
VNRPDRAAPLLAIRNLEVAYGEVQVLWDVSLTVAEGSITALLGPNGAGKSTLLKAVMGLTRPQRGEIVFAGRRIDGRTSHEITGAGLSLVLEGGRPFPEMTVSENLDLGSNSGRSRARAAEARDEVFDLFPVLRQRRRQAAGTLSGGERQMLALGRALMGSPRLLMLDEPSLGLAPLVVEQMFQVIERLNTRGITILLVEQNVQHSLKAAHYSYVLETGKVVLEGGRELLGDEYVKTSYLGLSPPRGDRA